MSLKKAAGAILPIVAGALPVSALAQTGEATGAVADIVVTAQRREERLQEVPIAISVVTRASAQALGVTDTQSLQNVVPGLAFNKFGSAAVPFIRGVGSLPIAQGDENSVAIYIDGVLQLSPNGALFSLSNIERVEVLKGPQGTLFGRNANGGVINVTTRKPGQTLKGDAALSYGNYQTVEGKAYVGGPLSDTLSADIAFFGSHQDEGWGLNLATGREIYKSREFSLRSKWVWKPDQSTEVMLSGGYSQSHLNGNAFHPAVGELGRDGVTVFQGMYNVSNNVENYVDTKGWDASLQITRELGWADLVSLSAYSHLDSDRPGDSDATPANLQAGITVDQIDKGFTQELQLRSPASSSLKWVAGLYYLDSLSGYREPNAVTVVGAALGGLPYLRIHGKQKSKAYAAFAQATAPLATGLNLTLGARYTEDKRHVVNYNETPFGAAPPSSNSATFDKFTYKVTLDYQLIEGVMAYASHSTGFKAGLFNVLAPGAPPVRPETLKAYEVGVKSTLFDRRLQLNGAVYRYNFTDIQANVFRQGAAVTSLLNVGKARITGVDLDFNAAPTEWLTITGGLAYVDAKYTRFPGAPILVPNVDPVTGALTGGRTQIADDASGNRMVRTPKWQWSIGGQVHVPAGDNEVRLSANLNHQSRLYWDFSNQFSEGPRDMLSAEASFTLANSIEVAVWGRNLLNESYAIHGLPSPFGFLQVPGAPRTYGVRLGYSF